MIKKTVLPLLVMFAFALSAQTEEIKYGKLDNSAEKEFFASFKKCVENVKTLKVFFSQDRHMAIFTETLSAEGKCFFKYPDKLRWEISKPYKSVLVYNGDSLAKFDFDNGVYRKMNSGNYDMLMEVLSQINAWMKGDFSGTEKIYDLTVFASDKDFKIQLVPKDKNMKKVLQCVELLARKNDYHIIRVTIRENKEDYIEINFSKEEINRDFSDDFFNTGEVKEH
jgi:outer membrane lipoprotein-sorting protein